MGKRSRPLFYFPNRKLSRKPKRRRGAAKVKTYSLFFILFLVFSTFLYVSLFDRRILPLVMEISNIHAAAGINRVIARDLAVALDERGLASEDFYIKTLDGSGNISSLSVNALLVNEICAMLAGGISTALANSAQQEVFVPMGMFTGINAFAAMGPAYKVRVMPVGFASVDYSSSFVSAGINQINFQIWLDITASVRVVIPLNPQTVSISRRVLLVNTVFSGEVPSVYLGGYNRINN